MATNQKTVNGITYYGIVTYEEINKGVGSTIFANTPKRCLTKQVASPFANYYKVFTYDDDDPDYGKLLKYKSINFQVTIPIEIENKNNSSYKVKLSPNYSTITFSDPTKYYTFTETFPTSAVSINPSTKMQFTILNKRGLMTRPDSGYASGQVSVEILIKGQIVDAESKPKAGVPVYCTFWGYSENGYPSNPVTPTVGAVTIGDGSFTYIYKFVLSWYTKSDGDIITSGELNDIWPNGTSKILIQIKPET